MDSVSSDEVYQDHILPHVSRTFALTIPQLPLDLRTAVTCAYLLCRIADTIEDEPALSPPETLAFLQRFSALLAGRGDPKRLAREIEQRLSDRTPATERDLVSNMERVLGVMARLNEPQRAAIRRCVELMCYGMPRFQFNASLKGLDRSSDLDDYCYYVAGVVGEMLTELFCDYSPEIAGHRPALSAIAASFAQGLQMTNILKDVWEDRSRGACWLPQEVFTRYGVDLADVSSEPFDPLFGAAFRELIGVAHAHLRNALDYTLLIPSKETGIRRFCLWAIGLAVLTLRKIERNPRFTAGAQVKVTRSTVAMIRLLTDVAGRSDWMLRTLFAQAARGLPLARLSELRRPRPAPMSVEDASSPGEPEHALRRSYGNSGS
jgi:farnesyl-diphosphate farnesyltransferase